MLCMRTLKMCIPFISWSNHHWMFGVQDSFYLCYFCFLFIFHIYWLDFIYRLLVWYIGISSTHHLHHFWHSEYWVHAKDRRLKIYLCCQCFCLRPDFIWSISVGFCVQFPKFWFFFVFFLSFFPPHFVLRVIIQYTIYKNIKDNKKSFLSMAGINIRTFYSITEYILVIRRIHCKKCERWRVLSFLCENTWYFSY